MNKNFYANFFFFFFLFQLLFVDLNLYAINPLVLTSNLYLKDIIQQVTCNSIAVESILNTQDDPHTYQMVPHVRLLVAKSPIIVEIDPYLEPWLDKIPVQKNQKKFVMTKMLEEKKTSALIFDKQTGILNPHIWHSPILTKEIVIFLSIFLKENFPQFSNKISVCSKNYLNQIDDVVIKINQEFKNLPKEKKYLAMEHASLAYFAKEFGFENPNLLGISDESKPTFKQIYHFIQQLKAKKIHIIFPEMYDNSKSFEALASDSSLELGRPLFADSLGKLNSGADTVLGMWIQNSQAIKRSILGQ